MKRRDIILTIFFALTIFSVKSEIINGPANIRVEPNKQIILSLKDSVFVDCTELNNDWYQISITIRVTKDYYNQDRQVKKGQKLITLDGDTIGIALEDIPTNLCSVWTSGGAKDNPAIYGMNIYAYTHKNNIKHNSVPENLLIDLINKNTNDLRIKNFSNFISTFHLKKDDFFKQTSPTLIEYMIYENAIDDPSPMDRIRLVFEENKLVAIIHSRAMTFNSTTSTTLTRGLKISVFKTPKNTDIKTFIKNCADSYNGVD